MIALSVGGPSTYSGEGLARTLLVATVDGVVMLQRDERSTWTVVDRSLGGSHVSSLVVEPRSGQVFAGVYKGGVHASTDGGRTWQPRCDGLTETHVYCVYPAPAEGGVILYCGTEPAGLFRSTDLGARWEKLERIRDVASAPQWNFPSPPFAAHVKNVAVDAKHGGRIFVGVEQGALLKSEDGGATFRDLHGFFNDVHRIAIDPSDSDSVYISTGAGIYHSADAGETWTRMTTNATGIGYPDALLIDPRDPNVMLIAGSVATPGTWRKTHSANARILRSRDRGKTWERVRTGLPEHLRGNVEAMTLNVNGTASAIYAGTTDGDLFASEDAGDTWTKIASGLPPISKWGHYLALKL